MSSARPQAFTLLEMVVSLAIMSLILFGIGSAMLIAAGALPTANSDDAAALDAAQRAETFVRDVQYAVTVPTLSDKAITFTVADRDGDDTPETIQYRFSGVAGSAWLRQMNDEAAVPFVPNVTTLSLSYDWASEDHEQPTGSESAPTLHRGHITLHDFTAYTVSSSGWIGQFARPSLPSDTLHWAVTRVEFYARETGGSGGIAKVQLQRSTPGGLPSGVVLGERLLYESTLDGHYRLVSLTYPGVTHLSPQEGICLVIRQGGNGEPARILADGDARARSHTQMIRTSDGGFSWSVPANRSLLFWIYGTVTTAGIPVVQTTHRLAAVHLELNTSTSVSGALRTTALTLNRPEVTP